MMETVIFNNLTIGQVIPWAAGVIALLIVLKVYKKLFAKKKVNLQHTVYFACSHCGWEGHISKFGTRCPKCNAAARDADKA